MFDLLGLGAERSCADRVSQRIPPPTDQVKSAEDWRHFSLAEHLAGRVDPAWETWKTRGNAALKRGEHAEAVQLYLSAAQLALGPIVGGLFDVFLGALSSWPEQSAQWGVHDSCDLRVHVLGFLPRPASAVSFALPSGKTLSAAPPNKPAAIAFTNCAAAFLAAGNPAKALEFARRATKACPEYVKGHYREKKALSALGDAKAAKEKASQITDYRRCMAVRPSRLLALLGAGWIDWQRHALVYQPWCRRVAFEYIDEACKGSMETAIGVSVSLVPFEGGQCAIFSTRFVDKDWKINDLQVVDFSMASACPSFLPRSS